MSHQITRSVVLVVLIDVAAVAAMAQDRSLLCKTVWQAIPARGTPVPPDTSYTVTTINTSRGLYCENSDGFRRKELFYTKQVEVRKCAPKEVRFQVTENTILMAYRFGENCHHSREIDRRSLSGSGKIECPGHFTLLSSFQCEIVPTVGFLTDRQL